MNKNRWISGELSVDKLLAFIFGAVFVTVLLVVALANPNFTASQRETFRTILALAAGAVGAVIPGLMEINGRVMSLTLRATGALALIALVYLISPG